MTKTEMSTSFAKFEKKTTKASYDEARKGERIGRGVPFPVGTTGTGIVSKVNFGDTKPDKEDIVHPRISVEIKVETPEDGRGKTLGGPGLMQDIKDGPNPDKWSKQMAFNAALGLLEDLGLPKEISTGYESMQEILDWFEAEPRKVSWEVQANNYVDKNGNAVNAKQVRAYALLSENASGGTAEGEATVLEDDPDATYCKYRGVKHKILSQDGESLKIQSTSNPDREREVEIDDVEML